MPPPPSCLQAAVSTNHLLNTIQLLDQAGLTDAVLYGTPLSDADTARLSKCRVSMQVLCVGGRWEHAG